MRGNGSLHIALQSNLTAFNNDPALPLHRVYRGEWVVPIGHTLSLSLPSFVGQMDVFFYSSYSTTFGTK